MGSLLDQPLISIEVPISEPNFYFCSYDCKQDVYTIKIIRNSKNEARTYNREDMIKLFREIEQDGSVKIETPKQMPHGFFDSYENMQEFALGFFKINNITNALEIQRENIKQLKYGYTLLKKHSDILSNVVDILIYYAKRKDLSNYCKKSMKAKVRDKVKLSQNTNSSSQNGLDDSIQFDSRHEEILFTMLKEIFGQDKVLYKIKQSLHPQILNSEIGFFSFSNSGKEMEFDFAIEIDSKWVIFEYDGFPDHAGRITDIEKSEKLSKAGVSFCRLPLTTNFEKEVINNKRKDKLLEYVTNGISS